LPLEAFGFISVMNKISVPISHRTNIVSIKDTNQLLLFPEITDDLFQGSHKIHFTLWIKLRLATLQRAVHTANGGTQMVNHICTLQTPDVCGPKTKSRNTGTNTTMHHILETRQ
jgi:hypothetical protein